MKNITVEAFVPLPTVIVCKRADRSPQSFDTIRKFKVVCGNTLEVRVTRAKAVRSITALDACQRNCQDCAAKDKFIRELIAAGK